MIWDGHTNSCMQDQGRLCLHTYGKLGVVTAGCATKTRYIYIYILIFKYPSPNFACSFRPVTCSASMIYMQQVGVLAGGPLLQFNFAPRLHLVVSPLSFDVSWCGFCEHVSRFAERYGRAFDLLGHGLRPYARKVSQGGRRLA